jgi:site-specific DNA recombinase
MQQNRATVPTNAVIYARVSSKEQEKEGFPIPAQLELLRDYSRRQNMVVLEEFVDVESASAGGRTGFGRMLAYLRKNQSRCRNILMEKTDRLYRNISDYSKVEDSGVTVHFVKEGSILSPDSRSSDQFMHGIRVLMARNYSQNLGEETRKGMLQEARSGFHPSSRRWDTATWRAPTSAG